MTKTSDDSGISRSIRRGAATRGKSHEAAWCEIIDEDKAATHEEESRSRRSLPQGEAEPRRMKGSADLRPVSAPPVGRALTEWARWTRFKLRHSGRPLRVRRRGSRETWREVAHDLIERALHAESLRKRYRQGATESQRRSLERLEQHIRDVCDQADEYCLGPHRPAGRRHHK